MSSPAAARGEAVRARLLDAAAELVAERGWAAVSTRILAERAGLTPSVVHYHFASVQVLLTEAVVRAMREVLGSFEPLLDAVASPAELVGAMLTSVAGYTGSDPMSLLFVEACLASSRDEPLRRAMDGILIEFRAKLSRWLGGHGVPDPDGTAAVLAAAVDGLLLHRALHPEGVPAPVADVLSRLVPAEQDEETRT